MQTQAAATAGSKPPRKEREEGNVSSESLAQQYCHTPTIGPILLNYWFRPLLTIAAD